MSEVWIREAAAGDAGAISSVHVRSFLSAYAHLPTTRRSAETGMERRTELWHHRLEQAPAGRTTLVAIDGNETVGFVHLGPSPDPDARPDTGHIFSIHVAPGRTGEGVGRRLMERARERLGAGGFIDATLWVVADNLPARRFYEDLGWRDDGARRRESLAVGSEEGDEVEVSRYRLDGTGAAGVET